MIIKIVLVFITIIYLSACSNEKQDNEYLPNSPLPSFSEYSLSDFTLNDSYIYWEVRRGQVNGAGSINPENDTVLMSFDNMALNNLTDQQLTNLEAADSEIGFSAQCLPGYCPIYGVALINNDVVLLTTKTELLNFFEKINSVAELNIWLWANKYVAEYYEKVESGYMVLAAWDNLCGTRGKDLVFVDSSGNITKQNTISTESYNGCV